MFFISSYLNSQVKAESGHYIGVSFRMASLAIEQQYRLAFETLPGYNLLISPDAPLFTIAAVSDELIHVTALHRSNILGKSVFTVIDILGSLPSETLTLILRSVIDSRSEYRYEPSQENAEHPLGRLLTVLFKPVMDATQDVVFIAISLAVNAQKSITLPPGGPSLPTVDWTNALMQAPVAMGILRGPELRLEMANAQMLNLWGKGPEIIGLPIVTGLPEIANQPFPDLLRNVYETGVEYHGVETPAYIRHGTRLLLSYFNFVYSPLKDESGTVTGIMMVATEVTSLVKARKELEESERRYRDLIAKATVATAIYIGDDMVIRLANEAMLKLWGKTNNVIGKPLREGVPELEGQPFHKLLNQVFRTGVTYHSTEDRADLMIDGKLQTFYFNFTYKALRDSEGKIYGILNMAVDVSDMVKARMEINNAEERWRIALQSAELGTWDYYPNTREFYCSARTKELFGISTKASVTMEDLVAGIYPKDRQRLQMALQRAMNKEGGGHYRIEYGIIGAEDKRVRWHRATGQVFYDDLGKPQRVTGTVLDITERKRIEEALEERVLQRTKELMQINKELERSNMELEQYAYVASHDLQEPLRKIMVYTDLLRNDLPPGSAASSRLQKVLASANRMSSLIRDLLNFSRLIKTEKIFSKVDLNTIVRNVLEDFELRVQETGATFEMGQLPQLEASPQQMNQLFYNLISNALKFRHPDVKPRIKISASTITDVNPAEYPDLQPGMLYHDISVEDNGIGFSEKYTRQIFEIFKRLHTRSKYEGTGIGLALCRKIARNHKGEIFAESKEGSGSVFHIILPASQS